MDSRSADLFESPNTFCEESSLLQQHLAQKEYLFHPCDDFRKSLALQKQCEIFSVTAQPAYEVCWKVCALPVSFSINFSCVFLFSQEFQANTFQKHYLGAAIVPDIVHHVFQGNVSRFLTKRRQMR